METVATTDVGRIGAHHITEIVSNSVKKRKNYNKSTGEQRYNVWKCTTKYGNYPAAKKLETEFPKLKKSALRTFKIRYYKELKQTRKEQRGFSKERFPNLYPSTLKQLAGH